jgi:hypothetical protein
MTEWESLTETFSLSGTAGGRGGQTQGDASASSAATTLYSSLTLDNYK